MREEGRGGVRLDRVSPGGEDRNRNEKEEKAKASRVVVVGGEAILLALIDFLGNNVISVSFFLYTHSAERTLTHGPCYGKS